MIELISGLVNVVATGYNTLCGSTVLVPGENAIAGALPESPNFCVAVLNCRSPHDPSEVTKRVQFDLVVRGAQNDELTAATAMSSMVPLIDGKVNLIHGWGGFYRRVEEAAGAGQDKQQRVIFVTRFIVWSV
jgi:hypothetical protein